MTLDVICDVSIEGNSKSLELLKATLFETIESAITVTGLAIENYKVLSSNSDFVQVFFTTRNEPPTLAIKSLAEQYTDLIFEFTFDNQIGNSARFQFQGDSESQLEYISEFNKELKQLVSEGKLPSYGIIASGKTEDEVTELILHYAEGQGYEESDEHDEDREGFALDWLTDNVGLDFGSFETEGLNFIFRPWESHEL